MILLLGIVIFIVNIISILVILLLLLHLLLLLLIIIMYVCGGAHRSVASYVLPNRVEGRMVASQAARREWAEGA